MDLLLSEIITPGEITLEEMKELLRLTQKE